MLPLPKKREAIAPSGFTRRYGNSIAARIRVVQRDGLDACLRGELGVTKASEKTTEKRSEEHTSELQSLIRSSYAVFCLKKKKRKKRKHIKQEKNKRLT